MKTKSNNFYLIAIILSVIVLVTAGAYAYYQTSYASKASGNILAWSFKVNNETKTFTKELGDLYPGVSGEIPLELSAVGSGVDVNYEISIAYDSTSPTIKNLKFYSNKLGTDNYADEVNETSKLTGTITAGEKINRAIYYYWPFGDDSSTTDDYNDKGKDIKLIISVIGRQA